MKKYSSQIVVALVCALLGFLLSYQFKLLNKKEKAQTSYEQTDIITEVESLKKERDELKASNNKILEDLKKLEDAAAKEGELEGEVKKQLDAARMQLGLVDVSGEGVIITISPKTSIFGGNTSESSRSLSEQEIVHIVNLLWYSRAEAISVNDFRITPQTGIKNSGNYIWIGSEGRIDPKNKIEIKVIGDKTKLNVGASFPGTLDFGALQNYNCEVKTSDEVIIKKSNQTLNSDYIKLFEE